MKSGETPSRELLDVAALLRKSLNTCILPWFGKLESDQIGEKGPEDFVTIADTTAETFLGERLTRLHPGSRMIGEEGTAANPGLLATLHEGACWIVDPVDGTMLFKNREPHFGTLVSRSKNGKTEAGWILETFLDASGIWITASCGRCRQRCMAFALRHPALCEGPALRPARGNARETTWAFDPEGFLARFRARRFS